ncbi:hypothetical protein MVEG_11193 [Podila verticillata NRRL 6337]|uniref:SIT4 phosphatase-associated protein n=1 Tax=Podila verticillata NRRL 6337 TaxID=1069443 RepID=A0A086TMH9_9FUNG|nr:hypothetical protein MVEG_11193 [Podila verticillata NRRL 6337]
MYWRFGHQNASVIDHLLESGSVSLEELLEQDDLIQECKSQNQRLIEYLRDPPVLSQLLNYIISDDLEDRARFKYPFIACEVIACEVWGIFESALSNIDMLVKFWEFLDRPAPLNPVQASYFAKVIGVFLMKKTGDMLEFIKSQPDVVPKLLLHMSTSSIMDLLLKIISMEEAPEGRGTVEWLSKQGLMPWLVNQLDPNFDAEVHSIASQVLLDIIAISQSSHPEQPSIGTNVLIDELKSEVIVSKLVNFMLDRTAPHSTSTLINGVTIFIELIRRNNSDYDVEPLPPGSTDPIREAVDLSDLLKVLASRIEDFKDLLVVPRSVSGPIETSIGRQTPLGFERLKICEMFAELLHCSNMAVLNSRPIITVSADGTVKVPSVRTVARQPVITAEEELDLEAAIASAASSANAAEDKKDKDASEEAKEVNEVKEANEVKEVNEVKETNEANEAKEVKEANEAKEAKEVKEDTEPKTATDNSLSSESASEKKEDVKTPATETLTTVSEAEEKKATSTEETYESEVEKDMASLIIDDQATPRGSPPPSTAATPKAVTSQSSTSTLSSATIAAIASGNTMTGEAMIPVGDFLKLQFVDHQIIPTCFDLFFQFPWNNFLHTVVYDMVHQVFHRPMGDIGRPDIDGTYIPPQTDQGVTEGWNRRLTISIFKDGQLTKRITDAQRLCDYECAQPKGVRLGYMGHLTYIADETVKLLELYSQTSLLPMLYEFIDLDDWWSYVSKTLKETKERDAQVLGGSRPNMMDGLKSGLDDGNDDDFMDDNEGEYGGGNGFLGQEGGSGHDGDVASDQFARYLSQQISNNLPDKFGSSDEDEDDEEGNWIGEYGVDNDFERRRAAANAANSGLGSSGADPEDPFGSRHAMDLGSDDEDNVDEEAWNSSWPTTFGDSKALELGSVHQFSAPLSDWSEDFQDGFSDFKTGSADGKDDFDFPPFEGNASVAVVSVTEGEFGFDDFTPAKSTETTTSTTATTFTTELDTPATEKTEALPESSTLSTSSSHVPTTTEEAKAEETKEAKAPEHSSKEDVKSEPAEPAEASSSSVTTHASPSTVSTTALPEHLETTETK